jgi:hypothetical protein
MTIIKLYKFTTYVYDNLLQATGYVMQNKFNIQELYSLPTLCLCVLYLFENQQRLVPLSLKTDWCL